MLILYKSEPSNYKSILYSAQSSKKENIGQAPDQSDSLILVVEYVSRVIKKENGNLRANY